jgi:single-strand DNA-binding protein
MLNILVLQGRLTRDPEIRTTQSGSTVAGFTLAVDRDYQPGGSEKKTDFVDCSAWRSTAGFIERNFHKGNMVIVRGQLQSRKWQDKNGQNRVSWEIQADNLYFGDSKPSASQGGGYGGSQGGSSYGSEPYGAAESYSAPSGGSGFADAEDDGELPF